MPGAFAVLAALPSRDGLSSMMQIKPHDRENGQPESGDRTPAEINFRNSGSPIRQRCMTFGEKMLVTIGQAVGGTIALENES